MERPVNAAVPASEAPVRNAPDPGSGEGAGPGHPTTFYGRLARYAMSHRALVVGLVALVTVIAGVFAARLRIDSDILSLMPAEDPSVQILKRLDKEEGGTTMLTLSIEGDTPEQRDAFLEQLETRLRALPQVEDVLWRVEPDLAWRLGLLQVPVADLTQLRDRLRTAVQLGPAAANPFVAAQLFDLGPLAARLDGGRTESGLTLTTKDGVTRMVVRPKGSAHDLPFARAFMADVHRILDELQPEAHGAHVRWIGGGYRHNVEDYEGVVRDMGWITSTSFVLVLVILAGAFRSPRALVALFVPLLVSNVWTLGVAGATVGALNTFTSFSNAVLIGVGVEFGVHLFSRYREQRVAGHAVEDAVVRAWDLVGGACTSAAFTSGAGFLALVAAHFAGFRQLGWILALGLFLCLVAVMVLTPILIVATEGRVTRVHAPGRRGLRRNRPSTYRLAPVAILVLACVTLVAGLLIRKIRIEYDISELRQDGLAWSDLSEKERALVKDSYSPAIAFFPDAESLDKAATRLQARIDAGKVPEVARVLSIRNVLPADQDARLALLQEIATLAKDPAFVYLPAQVQGTLARLRDTTLAPIAVADLPGAFRHVLGADRGEHRLLIAPAGNMWDMRESAVLLAAVERELPGVEVAGEFMTLGTLYRLMGRDAPVVGGIAVGLVLLFTALDLQRVRATLGAMAVLVAGMCWWGALLVLSDIHLSLVNVVGIPIVLGIGIDVMIHLIHRLHQEGPGSILKSLATTGWASALGTSTTVVAFAALSLASSQGVRSLGLLVLLGEMAVTVAGFVLVPLGFATAWRFQGRHPAARQSPDFVPLEGPLTPSRGTLGGHGAEGGTPSATPPPREDAAG